MLSSNPDASRCAIHKIYLVFGILSILMTGWFLFLGEPISPDSIRYLQGTQLLFEKGFHASLLHYNWPFYSILIGYFSKLTTLSFLNAACVLNVFFDTLTILFFIKLLKELGGNKRTLWLGGFVILLFPFLNHYRFEILRGHGYFCFMLLSLIFLIHYMQTRKWRDVILWNLSVFIAGLFRIEGFVFLVFVPLISFFDFDIKFWARFKSVIRLYLVPVCVFIMACLGFFLFARIKGIDLTFDLGRLPELKQAAFHLFQEISAVLHAKGQIIETQVLPSVAHTSGIVFLIWGLAGAYLVDLIQVIGLLYFILVLYTCFLTDFLKQMRSGTRTAYLFYMVLNLFMTLLFLFKSLFLSGRYVGFLSLLLLLAVPFGLQSLYKGYQEKRMGQRWFFPIIVLWIIVIFISSVYWFGPRKAYLVKTAHFVNTSLMSAKTLCVNDSQMGYYLKQPFIAIPLVNDTSPSATRFYKAGFSKCDVIIYQIGRHDYASENKLLINSRFKTISQFKNRRGDRALVIKVTQ